MPLKRLEDINFLNVTVRRMAGGEILTEEHFVNGESQGRTLRRHYYNGDEVANYEACFCGRREDDPIHVPYQL